MGPRPVRLDAFARPLLTEGAPAAPRVGDVSVTGGRRLHPDGHDLFDLEERVRVLRPIRLFRGVMHLRMKWLDHSFSVLRGEPARMRLWTDADQNGAPLQP